MKKVIIHVLDTEDSSKDEIREMDFKDYTRMAQDALCFNFWIESAEDSPASMAKMICQCLTADDYRRVIWPLVQMKQQALLAMRTQKF